MSMAFQTQGEFVTTFFQSAVSKAPHVRVFLLPSGGLRKWHRCINI